MIVRFVPIPWVYCGVHIKPAVPITIQHSSPFVFVHSWKMAIAGRTEDTTLVMGRNGNTEVETSPSPKILATAIATERRRKSTVREPKYCG